MKKIKKFVCIIICLFLAICQINSTVYGYTLDEVKKLIDFQLYDGENEPEDYDIKIDASELLLNEKLPCIVTTIEKVLYSDDGIFNIDFLGNTSSSKDNSSTEKSDKNKSFIRNNVRVILKVLLYISAAAMLTLLIYMSVITVSKGISEKSSILPFSKIYKDTNGEKTPGKSIQAKRLIEQWFVSVILLILLPYLINFTVAFSNYISSFSDNKKMEEDSITVYVKNSIVKKDKKAPTTVIGTSDLSSGVEELIASTSAGGNWSVYAKNLKTNTNGVAYNTNKQMPSASVIKLFIAATAYDKAKNSLSYTVNENDMREMITASDNDAANRIIDSLGGFAAVNHYASANGYSNTVLNRKFGITVYSKDNYTNANDVGSLLEKIYNNSIPGAGNILGYMKNQQRRTKIPQGVPSGVQVANKTGELGSNYQNGPVENDAAIVYKENANYILVILSSNLKNDAASINTIKEISTRVYNSMGSSIAGGTASSNSTSIVDTAASNSLREKVVELAKNQDNLGITTRAYCEGWVEEVYRTAMGKSDDENSGIPRQCCAHNAGTKSIVSNSTDDIIPGAAVFSFKSSSHTIDSACGQDAGHVGIYIGDGKIASYLGNGNVSICTINEWQQSWVFSGWGWLPGTEELATGGSSDGGITENTIINYTFKTNLEGLMMFQSQYSWSAKPVKNLTNMLGGIALTLFKIFILLLYVVRMGILAMVTAFSPLIVLVNAFKKVMGNKGYLMNWFKLYLYLIFIRPAISLVYYIFGQENVYLATEKPMYIVIVTVGISILIIASIRYLIKDLNGKNQKNAASKKLKK